MRVTKLNNIQYEKSVPKFEDPQAPERAGMGHKVVKAKGCKYCGARYENEDVTIVLEF